MSKRVAIYHRPTIVKGDDSSRQLEELQDYARRRKWDFVLYAEKPRRNIKDTTSPVLRKLLRDGKNKQFDIVLCHSFLGLSYSMKHLLGTLQKLTSDGVGFISVKDGVSNNSSAVKFLKALMNFQRGVSGFSISIGMEVARMRNIAIGRRPICVEDRSRIIESHLNKQSIRGIAKSTRIARSTVFHTVKKYKNGDIGKDGQNTKVA